MTQPEDRPVSAMVLLRPDVDGEAGTAPEASPAPDAAAAATCFFAAAGFELGPVVGRTFSITGPRSLFESTFEPLEEPPGRHGSHRTARGALELDLGRLPDRVSRHVEGVAFSRPPDFGPTSF